MTSEDDDSSPLRECCRSLVQVLASRVANASSGGERRVRVP